MKPKNLQEWSMDFILELLKKGVDEDIWFDFKERLPDGRDLNGKERIRNVIASFANKEGGFIVFGIADNKKLEPEKRLVGISIAEQYPVLFGNLLSDLIPKPDFRFKNPPLKFSSDKVIHIVEILESLDKPVSVMSGEGLSFPIRTPKGTDFMRYDDVKQNFLGYAHMRDKLLLLGEELKRIMEELKQFSLSAPNLRTVIIGHVIQHDIISLCIAHAHGLLKKSPILLADLNRIRTVIDLINGDVQRGLVYYATNISFKGQAIEEFNRALANSAQDLRRNIEECSKNLDKFISEI